MDISHNTDDPDSSVANVLAKIKYQLGLFDNTQVMCGGLSRPNIACVTDSVGRVVRTHDHPVIISGAVEHPIAWLINYTLLGSVDASIEIMRVQVQDAGNSGTCHAPVAPDIMIERMLNAWERDIPMNIDFCFVLRTVVLPRFRQPLFWTYPITRMTQILVLPMS